MKTFLLGIVLAVASFRIVPVETCPETVLVALVVRLVLVVACTAVPVPDLVHQLVDPDPGMGHSAPFLLSFPCKASVLLVWAVWAVLVVVLVVPVVHIVAPDQAAWALLLDFSSTLWFVEMRFVVDLGKAGCCWCLLCFRSCCCYHLM